MIHKYDYHKTHFLFSTSCIKNLLYNVSKEIAFTGSSNVGKSSVINTLTNQKNLARTSKKPGSTKTVNVFEVEPGVNLIDLPGYGYVTMPVALKYHWQHDLIYFLQKCTNLKGLVVLMDIRHPMKFLDKYIIQCAIENKIQVFILLNKADKMNAYACNTQYHTVQQHLSNLESNIKITLFSSVTKLGIKKLKAQLDSWFSIVS
ncbi:ribosome biogenesis GTP-binding protein YihA/YsxC [Candidatus Palibaumannia cicadellinicola]|uniref:Probable GTP-binding protein EngB n=1 Tax=Baumannia cicadellinicola subsp. Homalodisca coagulata TaxID=374463 RepID=ENGB_BAUCH|nr:ribosome biogenesis GTP-binding protein YihA/YsxC [Candidatus Baumannia cicadellinicola]Q1LTY0.1 RecName: Full=Probable GTP-binding protein EngB [Baumannia cicadellinicola str. Hc (Homalodisca coagulata)]ABF13808.1 GTP-binding protein [Baumannia cicadellinicola str. Hc (Homalodisca coagulata)]MBS0032639.1 ribosome biogenesis GTP-binding protein YsxC [Candidatus Baumannia cicadellinicola]MCJ7462433.1 ribosome biogenesis GTP-binding protein YihA/YsxC [Candidatus Baumannia cicadellinicola]MCJ7